jgi:3-oxoadipate enol-lactonase
MTVAKIIFCTALLAGCAASELRDVQDGFAPTDNGRLYYQVAGSGDAVVLIHGNAGDHRHWNNQFEYLASRFLVIRYDVRGYGRSSVPVLGSPYSDSADLAQLLDYLNIEAAHIVGWSFGSGVAFDFATMFPERTKSLVSVGPWVNGYSSEAVDDLFNQMGVVADAVAEGGAAAGSNAFVDVVLGDTIFDDSASDFMRFVGSEYSWWAFSNPNQALALEPSAASVLSEMTVPVLVITAEHDLPVCREVGDLIDSAVPNSQQVVLEDTGHLMHIEMPDAFNAQLVAFIEKPR